MTAELTGSGIRVGVPIAEVERQLAALWQQTEEEHERDVPVVRVRMSNLVVYAEEDAMLRAAQRLADVLPARHPSRLIVVHADADEPGHEIDATLTARCAIRTGSHRQVCGEVITITVPAATRGSVLNAVAPLLVSDLPVALWWTPPFRPDDQVFYELTAELADRVIVDTRRGDTSASLPALAGWMQSAHHHARVSDLAWLRMLPWRQAVAELFDPPALRGCLDALRGVELTCAGDHIGSEALLFAGWLASRLGWRLAGVERRDGGLRAAYDAQGRSIRLQIGLEAPGTGRTGIRAVRLTAGDGGDVQRFEVGCPLGSDSARMHTEAPGRPSRDRVMAMNERGDADLIGNLLDGPTFDRVYEAALIQAAALVARPAAVMA